MSTSMTVIPKMTRNIFYNTPNTTAAPTSLGVQSQTKVPWMDLQNDLTDALAIGQTHVFMPEVGVTTTIPVATTAGGVGPTAGDITNIYTYKCYADVYYSVKGKFIDKSLI